MSTFVLLRGHSNVLESELYRVLLFCSIGFVGFGYGYGSLTELTYQVHKFRVSWYGRYRAYRGSGKVTKNVVSARIKCCTRFPGRCCCTRVQVSQMFRVRVSMSYITNKSSAYAYMKVKQKLKSRV